MLQYFEKRKQKKRDLEKQQRLVRAKQHLATAGINYDWFLKQDPLDRVRIIANIARYK